MVKKTPPILGRLLGDILAGLFEHDVFISHAREQREFVVWLRRRLRRFGLKVTFDIDLDPGDYWRERLAEAIERSAAAVVVETPESQASRPVEAEVLLLLYLQESTFRGALVPLLLTAEQRSHLAHLQSIDFRDTRWNSSDPRDKKQTSAQVKVLARALRQHRPERRPSPMLGAGLPLPERSDADVSARLLIAPHAPLTKRLLRRLSVRALLVLVVLSVTSIALGRGVLGSWQHRSLQADLATIQEAVAGELKYVRDVDEILLTHDTAPIPGDAAVRDYRDGLRGLIARDTSARGRLLEREFHRDNRLVARDKFEYQGEIPSGRTRTYYLRGGVTVVERYLQDGIRFAQYIQLHVERGDSGAFLGDTESVRVALPPPAIGAYR